MQAISRVDSIPGWMQPEDAEKLQELAHETRGPILEIGTYHGKSAVLMARAVKDAGTDALIYTLDVDKAAIRAASTQAEAQHVADVIVFLRGTLNAFARAYPRIRPSLTFIDGDHSRAGVESDLAVLKGLVPSGGVLLFHDFTDPLNDDPQCHEMKVRPAIEGSWVARECDFGGVFGCCGLFTRRTEAPIENVAMVDLSPLDSRKDQYLHRLRYPAGRLWKRLRGAKPPVPARTGSK